MTEKRYNRLVSSIDYYYCIDATDNKGLTEEDMLNRLNEQEVEIKQLKEENEGLKTELQNKTERLFCEIEMKMKYHSKLIDSEKENKDLKDFIRKISTNNEIILANGTIYKINKVIK